MYRYILFIRAGKRKRAGTGKHCDYLDKREYGPVKRRRTDPVISLSIFLENGELKNFIKMNLILSLSFLILRPNFYYNGSL
jgi:hypothetical protein